MNVPAPSVQPFSYPYDEFLAHYLAMPMVRQYEVVHLNYEKLSESVDVGDEHDLDTEMLRIWDYLCQQIPDEDERVYKAIVIGRVLTHLNRHIQLYTQGGFVDPGPPETPHLIYDPLLRALHQFYTQPAPAAFIPHPSSLSPGLASPDPIDMCLLAQQLEEQQAASD